MKPDRFCHPRPSRLESALRADTLRNWILYLLVLPLCFLVAQTRGYAQGSITHQITLAANQGWCEDALINGLFTGINTFRGQNGLPALTMNPLGMKDAEIRATQFAAYMATHTPQSPGFNPHEGYDTTAASLGYDLVSENLAYLTSSPDYVVYALWQDSLHRAAMLASDANVAGVSCIYSDGTPYWTYEPGRCSGSCSGGIPPPPDPAAMPDTEAWAFLTLLNAYRAQNGAGPLQVSVSLQKSSQWLSNDMAAKNYISHTDSGGRDPYTRLVAFGYPYSPWGENIAAGYADAQNTLNQWATACDPNASGQCTYAHRTIMLSSGFVAVGIGRAFGASSNYGWYWTTDFGGYLDQAITPPSGSAPVINSFIAMPASISQGQTATLTWSVSGASSLSIDQGVGDVSNSTTKLVTPSQTTTFKLTAMNAGGATSAFATVAVSVPFCNFAITQSSQASPSSGGPASVGVVAQQGCAWIATSNATWLTIAAGSAGSGNGTVSYTVSPNQTGSQRQGTLTIAGQNFTVTQSSGGNSSPSPGAVTPGAGSGFSQSFTFTFSNPVGWQALGVVNVLINNSLDARSACYLAYSVQSNTLFLVNDAGNSGGPFAGSIILNGSANASNGQCGIAAAGSSAVGNGNTLTLTLNLSFSPSFSGNKIIYMAARDTGTGNSGWQALGTWNVPGPLPADPAVGGIYPARSNSQVQTYSFTFTDSRGWQNIGVVNILVNSALDARNACYVAFVPSGAGSGSVYLVDDAGHAGGPFEVLTLPAAGAAQNSQCTISGNGSWVMGNANTLTLTLTIAFFPSFGGNRVFYLAARQGSLSSGWQPVGSLTIP